MAGEVKWATAANKGIKYSGFHLTINTNQSNDIYKEPLVKAVEALYPHINKFLKHVPTSWGAPPDPDFLQHVRSEGMLFRPTLEKNTSPDAKNNSWHVHLYLQWSHKTRIQLDCRELTKYFKTVLGLPGLHINVQYVKVNLQAIDSYHAKDPQYSGLPLPNA